MYLKIETESQITAVQDHALRTNFPQSKIDKSKNNPFCRMCKKEDKSVMHITSGSSKLAQKEYKKRHDNLGKAIHWDLCRAKRLEHTERWYEHSPENVIENEDWKILWDFMIQIDKVNGSAGARQEKCLHLPQVEESQNEKFEKYRDLARGIRRI